MDLGNAKAVLPILHISLTSLYFWVLPFLLAIESLFDLVFPYGSDLSKHLPGYGSIVLLRYFRLCWKPVFHFFDFLLFYVPHRAF